MLNIFKFLSLETLKADLCTYGLVMPSYMKILIITAIEEKEETQPNHIKVDNVFINGCTNQHTKIYATSDNKITKRAC